MNENKVKLTSLLVKILASTPYATKGICTFRGSDKVVDANNIRYVYSIHVFHE